MAETDRHSSTSAQLQQASHLIAADRPQLAERLIRTALSAEPHSAAGHALLAMALAGCKRSREAIAAADEAVRLEPNLALAHAATFRALQALGRPWEAEQEARTALELGPDQTNRYSDLGEALLRWGRCDESLAISTQGLTLDPRHLPCLHIRALSLVRLSRFHEAHEALAAALVEAPSLAELHAAVGLALEHQGELTEAQIEYREAARLDPGQVSAVRALHRVSTWYARVTPSHVFARARRAFARGRTSPERP